jgi:predicted nucleic acid-binding protein
VSGFVIDASVAVKWVVEEEGTLEAVALLRQQLLAPDLINAECANILWKKVRLGEMSCEEAIFAGRLLANADIDLTSTRPLLEAAVEIAIVLDHPAYDCVYLALAEQKNIEIVTADTRLIKKARAFDRFKWRVADLREWR